MSDTARNVGAWQVMTKVAESGFATSYEVRHEETGARGLLKCFPDAGDSHVAARFDRELDALDALEGAKVPRILDRNRDHVAGPYVVFEWIEGTTLLDLLRSEGPLSVAAALDVALALASTLERAHELGFLHRDVKPGNVMIPTSSAGIHDFPGAYLLDFGLAGVLRSMESAREAQTMPGVVVGSPAYMAPEQATGGALTAATDVWGVGVVLHEMVTGKLPFAGPTAIATIVTIVQERYTPPSELPTTVRALLERTLVKTANLRIPGGRELRLAVEQAIDALAGVPGAPAPYAGPSPGQAHIAVPSAAGAGETLATYAGPFPGGVPTPAYRRVPGVAALPHIGGPAAGRLSVSALLPSARDTLRVAVASSAAFLAALTLRVREENAVTDIVLGICVPGLAVGVGVLYREWSMSRRLRLARPLTAVRDQLSSLLDGTSRITDSLALDLEELHRVLEGMGADALHASVAVRMFHQYQAAVESRHDDLALVHAVPLVEHIESKLPWWIRYGVSIDQVLRVSGVLLGIVLLLRAAWILRQ